MFFMVEIKALYWAQNTVTGVERVGGGGVPPPATLDVCRKSKGPHEE